MLHIRTLFFNLSLLLLVMSLASVSLAAPLTDTENKHNLSSSATHGGPKAADPTAGGTTEICIFCHTPHSATPDSTLWSRPDPDTSTFPLYAKALVIKNVVSLSGYTNDGSVVYPDGASRLCLSCHDGVTSIGTLENGAPIAMFGGLDKIADIPGTSAVIDLSTSHPISFKYDAAVRDEILTVRGAGTYRLPSEAPFADKVDTPLDGNDKMQCTTCHDPHDDTSLDPAPPTGALPPFWRHSNALQEGGTYADHYEEVCGQCHLGIGLGAGSVDPGQTVPGNTDHNPGPVLGTRP